MAFTYSSISNTNSGFGTSATTGTITSPSNGDLVVFNINSNVDSASPFAPSINQDDGATWYELHNWDLDPDHTAYFVTAWKVANGSEPTSYSFACNNDYWRVIWYVFSAAAIPEVDTAINWVRDTALHDDLKCEAYDNQTINDNVVGVVFGGKDTRVSSSAYTTATQSYTGVFGNRSDQLSAGAYRIYTTGHQSPAIGDIIIDGATNKSGNTYSHHVTFREAAGGAFPYHSVKQQRKDMQTLLTM